MTFFPNFLLEKSFFLFVILAFRTSHILKRDHSLVYSFAARKICLKLHSRLGSSTKCLASTATICHKLRQHVPTLRLLRPLVQCALAFVNDAKDFFSLELCVLN